LVKVGSRVLVPFGPSRLQGVIVALSIHPPQGPDIPVGSSLRDIAELLDDNGREPDESLLLLIRLISEYYLAPWGQCLRLILPEQPRTRRRQSSRSMTRRSPAEAGSVAEDFASRPLPSIPIAWRDVLRAALGRAHPITFLLQAPATHRLACLLQATEEALARQRAALIIVPEISLASAIAGLAAVRWPQRVVLLHSGLSLAAHDEAWRRVLAGTADVVVGTRSAVFAPFPSNRTSLGLICVEQEEDHSLKEEQEPHYHAREVARMRANQKGAVLLLSSAHPSLETLQAVEPNQKLTLKTVNGSGQPVRKLPVIEAVDLRLLPYRTLLSEPLVAGIKQALSAKSRVILFLNRKGFAPLLHCLDCGASPHCLRCSVSLTFYRRAGRLSCRYCGESSSLPDTCSSCLAHRLEPVGFGTERLEEEVRRLFPQARIGRLDRDLARTQTQADAIRGRLAAGELDILIGTQMLFQGFPLPPVGLVGLPHADAGLHVPDFRSAERTYQTLLDAVELALPGNGGGKVILQTYMPTHHAIASVVQQNELLFYEQELAFRQALGYPPFTHLISLHVSGKSAKPVQRAAGEWAGRLKAAAAGLSPDEVTIMGPVPAPVAQLRGRHRWQLLVKSAHAEAARQTVRRTLEELERNRKRRGLKFDVDVDPLEMS
jgi:primosomal protein N' (replication factor Y)